MTHLPANVDPVRKCKRLDTIKWEVWSRRMKVNPSQHDYLEWRRCTALISCPCFTEKGGKTFPHASCLPDMHTILSNACKMLLKWGRKTRFSPCLNTLWPTFSKLSLFPAFGWMRYGRKMNDAALGKSGCYCWVCRCYGFRRGWYEIGQFSICLIEYRIEEAVIPDLRKERLLNNSCCYRFFTETYSNNRNEHNSTFS